MATTSDPSSLSLRSTSFPAEIVLDCLEALVQQVSASEDFSEAYDTLASATQVSRLWRAPAQKVLFSNVQLARSDHAASLFDTLREQGRGDAVRNLVVGVGDAEPGQQMLDASLLAGILVTCPNIRKLTLLHHDLPEIPTCLIPPLLQLTDVTIVSSGWKSSPRIEPDFLRTLGSVRFLQLPCPELSRELPSDVIATPPPFSLLGLSVQQYPSPLAEWTLRNSAESLQCLTVAYMGDLPLLARNHPRLRSLRILTRLSQTASSTASYDSVAQADVETGLRLFPYLERFEIRDLSIAPSFLRTLPPSIRYIRFWKEEVARELISILEEGGLSNLRTIVWDWWIPTGGSDDARVAAQFRSIMEELQRICQASGREFRVYARLDGKRASQGKDKAYELELRASCYKAVGLKPIPIYDEVPTKLPTRIVRDMHNLGLPLASHFKSVSPFMDRMPGTWSPIFEDCLEGHGDWLEKNLPALQKQLPMVSPGSRPMTPVRRFTSD